MGGVNVITDDFGSRVQLIEYDPWGKVSREEGIGDAVRRFTGHILDPESGLYYYGGRYYDPELGRFISPDPFVGQPDDPQNLNRYSYVVNNPVNYIDPDGYFHQVKKKKKKGGFFGSIFGAIFGFVFGGPVGALVGGSLGAASDFVPQVGTALRVLQIIGGIGMMLSGNPAGFFIIASGGLGFGKGEGFQIASAVTGFLGGLASGFGGGDSGGSGGSGGGSSEAGSDFGGFFSPALVFAAKAGQLSARSSRHISREIAGVQILFAGGAGHPVDSALAERFETAVDLTKQEVPELESLFISSTVRPPGRSPSLHPSGFAIDISRVNRIPIAAGFGRIPVVTQTVQSLQTNLGIVGAYENYGPALMQGPAARVPGVIREHLNHIHFSIKP